jgi:hypothetical protein
MKKWLASISVSIVLLASRFAAAQPAPYLSPEKFIVGGSAGFFRISYDDFPALYDGRAGLNYGGQALLKIFAPYFAVAKLNFFEKDGTVDSTGDAVSWRQRGVNLGVRYISYRERKLVSYFGFGFVFFNINESGPASLFGDTGGTRTATGLFLGGGLEFRFVPRASVFMDVEVSSAGLKGKSGFQGNSVGGFSIGLGMNVFVL